MWRDRALNLLAIGDQNLQSIADAIGYSSVDELVGNLQKLLDDGLIRTNSNVYSLTKEGEKYLDDLFYGRSGQQPL